MDKKKSLNKLEFHEVDPSRWRDLEMLFGKNGACGGCWCMWWRMKRSEYRRQKGEGNKMLMKSLIDSGEVPGILAYADGKPVGWCSVAPRERFSALERSRILQRVDEQPVWSVVCFFIAKSFRKSGLTVELLNFVKIYCATQGATIIEGYPVEPKSAKMPDTFAWTGFASAFLNAGFREAARRSETRPIMRFEIET